MSKLIDKLNQVSRATPQPMGFRAGTPVAPKLRLLLIASLAQASVDGLADYVAGADAGLLPIPKLNSETKTFQKICQAVPNIPWGVWLRDIGQGGIDQIVEVGSDFVVFPAANTPLTILQDDEVGKILQLEASLGEGLLRAVNELPIDAVLIGGEGEYFLTWHHLMLFQHFASLLTKPLLVCVPSNVTANELQALGEAGVDGVIVEVRIGQPAGRLNELRQIVDKLTLPLPRKRGKAMALLPYISRERSIEVQEEEE